MIQKQFLVATGDEYAIQKLMTHTKLMYIHITSELVHYYMRILNPVIVETPHNRNTYVSMAGTK